MALADYYNKVQAYFVASLGRPASSAELAQYAGALEANNGNVWKAGLVTYIQAQPDFSSDVATVYKNLTGAEPTMAIYNYYTGKMLAGEIKAKGLANAMINDLGLMPKADGTYGAPANWAVNLAADAGATDLTGVQNKITVANTFTSSLDSVAEATSYATAAGKESAKALLAGVTADADTVTTATANVDTTVANIVTEATTTSAVGQTFTLTKGVDVAPATTGTAGNDTYRADFDMEAAAGAGAHTLGALDAVDGGAGTDTLNITSDDGANPYTMAAATLTSIENINIEGSAAVTADVSGANISGLTALAVTKATSATLTTKNTTDVTVSGVTGITTVTGAKSATITQDTSAAVGDNSAGPASNVASIVVNKAKDVTITASNSEANVAAVTGANVADVDIGILVGSSAANAATGVVNITATGSKADGDYITMDAITVTGGTTVTVTQIATSDNTAALTDTNGATHTQGAVTITAGDATTDVTVIQAKETAAANYIAGVTGVKQTKTVTFTAMAANDTVTVDGLTFTAAKALTAAQVAAAFANMSNSETQQDGGITANGIYTGATSANWTSGAANGATVTFTAVTAATGNTGLATAFTDAGTGTLTAAPAVAAATAGLTAVTAQTGRLGVDNGAVTIDDNGATASIKNVTIDGYGANATLGGTNAMDALETLTLKNAKGGTTDVGMTVVDTLTLNVEAVDNDVDLDDNTASVTNLTINATGAASNFALTAANLTDLTVNAAAALTLTSDSFASANLLENVSVTGAGAVNLGNITGNNGLKTFTSTNTAGVTVSIDTDKADVTGGITNYQFGSGADVVTTTDTTVDIKVTLGEGNDKLTLASGTTTLAETIDGGEGTDTLVMAAADATTASASTAFEAKMTGFEKLEVGTVAAAGVVDVDLANMDDINYVITNGVTASNPGSTESTIVTFQALKSGQSVTVAGLTLTAAADMTAIEVAEVFDSLANGATGIANTAGTLTGWSTGDNAGAATVTFTATTAGNVTDLANSYSAADATAPTAPVVVSTDGIAGSTESSVVTFSSMVAGDVVTVNGLTLTATAFTEVATLKFTNVVTPGTSAADSTIIINGVTVSLADGAAAAVTYTAAEIAAAFATGSTTTAGGGTITVSGAYGLYSAAAGDSADEVVFTSLIANTDVTDLTVSGTASATVTVDVTQQGTNGSLTAAQVAEAFDGDIAANPVAAVLTGSNDATKFTATAIASGSSVAYTAVPAATNVTDIVTSGAVTVNTTQGVDATADTASVTFQALKSGQSVTVAGLTLTAAADMTAIDVAEVFDSLANGATGIANTTGTFTSDWTSADNSGTAVVVFTHDTVGTNSANLGSVTYAVSTAPVGSPTNATFNATQGGVGATALGSLLISNMANNGTIELKGANAGFNTTVEMTAASATTLNVMIKDQSATDLGNLIVDDVETIAITTTDTFTDTTGAVDQFGAATADGTDDANSSATVEVTGDAVETVTVTGAGDLSLTVTAATTLTAVNASTMTGALTYTANVADMTVTGGSAADNITVAANEVKVNGGDGADIITINAGVDLAVIDGGAGNDVFVINGAASNKDSYAVFNNVASGDVFDFSGVSDFVAAKVTLATGATESTQAYLNQAITNLAVGEMGWFQYNGNTFVVHDVAGSTTTFTDGTDVVIMIAGLKDLSTGATFNATNDTLEIV